MSEQTLLIAYRAMPSSVLEERMRLMQAVIAERKAVAREEEIRQMREQPYVKQVEKKDAPEHLGLEPMQVGPPPPVSDGTTINFLRGLEMEA